MLGSYGSTMYADGDSASPPELEGVVHRYVDVTPDVTFTSPMLGPRMDGP